jgi:hypothetical protein
MPYQLRTMSSSAVVAPASTLMVVVLTPPADGSAGVNLSAYCSFCAPVLARRMSDCQCELSPSR